MNPRYIFLIGYGILGSLVATLIHQSNSVENDRVRTQTELHQKQDQLIEDTWSHCKGERSRYTGFEGALFVKRTSCTDSPVWYK